MAPIKKVDITQNVTFKDSFKYFFKPYVGWVSTTFKQTRF